MGRGKPPAAAIPMSDRQYRLLEQESRKRTTLIQYRERIQILLRASKGESNGQIKRELGMALNTVKCWRKRWSDGYGALLAFEQGVAGVGVSDGELLKHLLELLKDAPGRGAPQTISLAQKQQIVSLACQKPERFGIPVTTWTHWLLAQVAIQEGIVAKVSARHVGTILKESAPQTPQK
jgi:putative transposase